MILKEDQHSLSSAVAGNPLWQTFVTPFTDIIDTGMYALERIGTVTSKELSSVILQTAVALIPFVGMDTMDAIEANAKENIKLSLNNLDSKYKDVINRNLDALLGQSDVWGLAFLFNPGLILGSKLMTSAPAVAAGFIGAILGGKDVGHNGSPTSIGDWLATQAGELQRLENDPSQFFFSQRQVGGGHQQSTFDTSLVNAGGGGYDTYGDYEGVYQEAQQQQVMRPQIQQQQSGQRPQQITPQMIKTAKDKILALIKSLFSNPQIKTQIASSNFSKQLQASGTKAISQGIQQTYGKIRSFTDMEKKYGNNAGFKKIVDQITTGLKSKNMTDKQIAQEKEKMFPEIKKQFKSMMIKQLQNTKMDPQSESNILKSLNTLI